MTIEDNLIRILSDKEISSVNDDFLDLRNYAAVLASLIRTTDTPITIGIQGDWGSGKSSLMRLIKQEIDPDQGQNKSIYTLWFNSWQFSQFNMEEQLTISLLLHFIEKIREINGREEIAQFVDKLRKIISKLPLKKVSLGFKTNDKILPVGQFNFNVDLENKEDDPSEKIKSLDTDLKCELRAKF